MAVADKAEDTRAVSTDPWVLLSEAASVRGSGRMQVLLDVIDGKVRHQKVAGMRVFHRDDLKLLRENAGNVESDDAES